MVGLAAGFLTAVWPLVFAALGVLAVSMLALFATLGPPLWRQRGAAATAWRV